jgi:hypothetical protein
MGSKGWHPAVAKPNQTLHPEEAKALLFIESSQSQTLDLDSRELSSDHAEIHLLLQQNNNILS